MAEADGGRFSRLDRKERYGQIVHRKVWYRRHVGVPFGSGEQRTGVSMQRSASPKSIARFLAVFGSRKL